MVGTAGMPAERVGDRGQDPVAGLRAEGGHEPVEPVELDEHDRGRPAVPVDPGVLVGEDPVPLAGDEHAGQRIGPARDPERLEGVDGGQVRARPGGWARRLRGSHGLGGDIARFAASTQPRPPEGERDQHDVGRDEDRQQDGDVFGHLDRTG